MTDIFDYKNRIIRFSAERQNHLETNHPEIRNQKNKIEETILLPDSIIQSNTDKSVELFYKYYESTPVGSKYLCVVVKSINNDSFIITAYFTSTIKRGLTLWKKK